jgi:membrane protein
LSEDLDRDQIKNRPALGKARKMVIWELVKKSFQEWNEDNAAQWAAAIAYYTVFSIPPLLIITLAIAGNFINVNVIQTQLVAQIQGFIGQQAAEYVKTLLESSRQSPNGFSASLISLIVLLAGASGAFFQVQHALNMMWDVPPEKTRGFWRTLKYHFQSFIIVLLIALLLLVFLIVNGIISVLISYLGGSSQNVLLAQAANLFSLFVLLTILIAVIFREVPDKVISWADVWLGAAVTAILFMAGRYAIGFYLSLSHSGSTFGVAGSLIVLLLWIYYSAEIFLWGVEFTQVFARRVGSRRAEPGRVGSRPTQTTH